MTSPPRWYVAIVAGVVVSATNPGMAYATGLSQEIDVGDRIEWAAPADERSVTFDGCQMVVLAKQGRRIDDDDRGSALDSVFASRVSLDGTVQDPMGVPVDLASALGTSNGGEVVAVENAPAWFGTPVDSRPSFARLGADLSILGRRTLDLPSDFQPESGFRRPGYAGESWHGKYGFQASLRTARRPRHVE